MDQQFREVFASLATMYLAQVEDLDPSAPEPKPGADYDQRNEALLLAAGQCAVGGMPVGFGFDPTEPDYVVLYIESPAGQLSWHLPKHTFPWDGHTTAEKYKRLDRWMTQVDEERAEEAQRYLD